MADTTVKRLEEMDAVYDGLMVRARASLGASSFGMQVMNLPPNFEDYPLHDETGTGQEEIYVPLEGSGRLITGGQEHKLEPGVFARVGVAEKRRIVPDGEGLRVLVIGGVPGRAYTAAPWTEVGAPAPGSEG
jgi:quercetin dioxygenase-like cupin family protein